MMPTSLRQSAAQTWLIGGVSLEPDFDPVAGFTFFAVALFDVGHFMLPMPVTQ